MSDDAGLDKIEARLDMAEKRHDILDDDLRQARDGFADMVQGVHNRVCKLEAAIKHHESGIDEHGNPLPETFADRLRHLERKVFQIESDRNPLRGFDVTCSVDELRKRILRAENDITILTAQLESITNQRSSGSGSMSDLAIRFQEIENRLNKLEQSERIHESNQNVMLETVKALAGTECPCDQTSDDFCDLMKRVDALESKPDIMTWLPSVLKDTDMRTRELERKRPYTTEWRALTDRLDALEARDKQDAKPKPACDKCGDTKIINETKQLHFNHSVTDHKLCPCVKVGDVVSAEVANMLPVGSQIRQTGYAGDEVAEKQSDKTWTDPILGPGKLNAEKYKLLRIGPDAATDDAHPTNCEPDHIADDSKKVEPDRAEELAKECLTAFGASVDDSDSEFLAIYSILRKHNVGRVPTIAEKLADPELKGVVEVMKACFGIVIMNQRLRAAVDAIPPELRAAIEAVR